MKLRNLIPDVQKVQVLLLFVLVRFNALPTYYESYPTLISKNQAILSSLPGHIPVHRPSGIEWGDKTNKKQGTSEGGEIGKRVLREYVGEIPQLQVRVLLF